MAAVASRITITRLLLLLLALLLLPPSSVISDDDGSRRCAPDASAFMAASNSSQMQSLTPSYKPVPSCFANQTCEDGACLQAGTYNSTTGCGAARQVSVRSNKKPFIYTCRNYSACTWTAPAPFASGGAWNGSADTDQETNAYLAGILASYVYADNASANTLTIFTEKFCSQVAKPLGFIQAKVYYRDYGLVWVFLETASSIIAVFRGTERKRDYGIDALSLGLMATTDFGAAPDMGAVWIGFGFFLQFTASKNYFLSELAKFKDSTNTTAASSSAGKALWFAGHSLGAAEATLFAAYAERNGHPVAGVYTFGSPVVGNAAWKAVYPLGSRTYRYAVPGDPVPYLGPIHVPAVHIDAIHPPRGWLLKLVQLLVGKTTNHVGILVIASCGAADAAAAVPSGTAAPAIFKAAAADDDEENDPGAAANSGLQPGQRVCGVAHLNLLATVTKATVTDTYLCSERLPNQRLTSSSSSISAAAAAMAEALAASAAACNKLPQGSSAAVSCLQQQQQAASIIQWVKRLAAAAMASPLVHPIFNWVKPHSMLSSYDKNIYFCLLSPPEQAAMPSYTRSVLAGSFNLVNSSS